MKTSIRHAILLLSCVAGFNGLAAQFPWVCDFTGDGRADPFWHYRGNSIQAPYNGIWFMSGTTITGGAGFPSLPISTEPQWSVVGTGKFHTGADSNRDILWRHDSLAMAAVWIMNGTTFQYSALLTDDPGVDWRIGATADFNEDGYTDILWDNKVTGDKKVWLMQGTSRLQELSPLQTGLTQWRVMCAGDFGSNISSTPDGHPDILLDSINPISGEGTLQVQYLRWNSATGTLDRLGDPVTCTTPEIDGDWQPLMAAGDVNSDTFTDIIWHHATTGQTALWYMDGAQFADSAAPFGVDEFDTDWRLIGQGNQDSTLRLDVVTGSARGLVSAAAGPGRVINLNWSVWPCGGSSYSIWRKLTTAASWGDPIRTVGTDTTGWSDNTVAYNVHYDYKVVATGTACSGTVSACVADPSSPNPVGSRGRAIVVVDGTKASALIAALDQLKRDLIADGWEVPNLDFAHPDYYTVPRHVDYPDPPARPGSDYYRVNNYVNVLATGTLIHNWVSPDPTVANVALLIGHVPVPYSGYQNTDGHSCCALPPDHVGAWASDLVYSTVDSSWPDWPDTGSELGYACQDSSLTADYTNCYWEENSNHAALDGKFDWSWAPGVSGTAPIVTVAVGRVDFARLSPAFSLDETSLLQKYFDKIHRFRYNLAPYSTVPFQPRGVTMNFPWSAPNSFQEITGGAIKATANLFGPNSIVVGDPFRQNRSKAFSWGFGAGFGAPDGVYLPSSAFFTSANLGASYATPSVPESRIGFFALFGSYFGDFDKSQDLMRAAIATPDYGFSAFWNKASIWNIDSMALGEHLGNALRRTVDTFTVERGRYIALMGDPTLRLYSVSAPSGVNLSGGTLIWTSVPGTTYYVYGTSVNSPYGPYTQIGTTTGGSWPVSGYYYSIVRAVRLVTTPSAGSYWEISQGVMKP
jgi:hypothetical protein